MAVYSGTFDPLTLGHEDVARRAALLFDEVVIAVAIAHHKKTRFALQERMDMAARALQGLPATIERDRGMQRSAGDLHIQRIEREQGILQAQPQRQLARLQRADTAHGVDAQGHVGIDAVPARRLEWQIG